MTQQTRAHLLPQRNQAGFRHSSPRSSSTLTWLLSTAGLQCAYTHTQGNTHKIKNEHSGKKREPSSSSFIFTFRSPGNHSHPVRSAGVDRHFDIDTTLEGIGKKKKTKSLDWDSGTFVCSCIHLSVSEKIHMLSRCLIVKQKN